MMNKEQKKNYITEMTANFENSEALNDYILINGRVDYNIKNYYLCYGLV
mgnify:CR=1 FL=1